MIGIIERERIIKENNKKNENVAEENLIRDLNSQAKITI